MIDVAVCEDFPLGQTTLPYTPQELMNGRPEHIVRIFHQIRAVLFDRLPNVDERAIPAAKMVHYLLRPPEFVEGPVLGLGPTNTHVTLFFVHGNVLDDPDMLLDRWGERLRGINITDEHQPEHPSIINLIDAARDYRRLRR